MKSLFQSEFERLWKQKLTWLFFAAIPCILFATAKYYLSNNLRVPLQSPEYVTANNFPVMALVEQLIVVFNVMSLVLLTLSFTEEYRTGQLRMVMLRAFTLGQLFRAKALAYLVTMLMFFLTYLAVSGVVGQLFFDSSVTTNLFYQDTKASTLDVIMYTVNYYAISLVTVVTIGSVFIAVAVLSQSTTAAIGMGMGFLLLSLGYPIVFTMMNYAWKLGLPSSWQFLSLTQVQYEGIAFLLADTVAFSNRQFCLTTWLILVGYITVCGSTAYFAFTKKDRWI
ncbi:hypothetical protein GK047_02000 [Paenibacillus sp. SYP-B3998]|uniref:ABC transporter permease subunit n=1 Tax=Paenibacillus sp. SYP-B3998 TaxID=2678564 RepID=A0A6G3ZRV8_9BACL|nr:hypothetical protein [Paenibacillus sp. SYP-B3998]NEW04790.1 hypothetical protein [Paenibacillus sp. SYP-B3998]